MRIRWIIFGLGLLVFASSGCKMLKEKVKERVPPPSAVIQALARSEVEQRENAEGFELTPPLPAGLLGNLRSCLNLKADKVEVQELGAFDETGKTWPVKVKVSGTCQEGLQVLGQTRTNPDKPHHFSGQLSLRIGKNAAEEWVLK